MHQYTLASDEDFGISYVRTWTVIYNGSVIVQFQSNPVVAIIKAAWVIFVRKAGGKP